MWSEKGRAGGLSELGARGGSDRAHAVEVFVKNSSAQPVYDVCVRWLIGTDAWVEKGVDSDHAPHLVPGESISYVRTWIEGGNLAMLGAVVEFNNAAGIRWRRREGGDLQEL
jgi:hypothetical protein